MIGRLLAPLASLRLTVTLMLAAIVLVFGGTLAQVYMGIQTVVDEIFRAMVVWVPVADGVRIPLPGGYIIGGALLVNLLAAHTLRFKISWKRSGILLIHGGLILILVGELVTGLFAVEANMSIDEGSSKNYSESTRLVELAFVDPSDPKLDRVVVVDDRALRRGGLVEDPLLPVSVEVLRFMPNSDVLGPVQAQRMGDHGAEKSIATAGVGVGLFVKELPGVTGVEDQVIDVPSAFLRIKHQGKDLGVFLVSLWINGPQDIVVNGRRYEMELRARRYYKPYTLHLIDFKHDKFTGTDIPRNFSSLVRLVDPSQNEDRQALIWMNNPLRYAGETFYQAAFKNNDKTTILQVVRNPGWLIPYISCVLVALGMTIHFSLALVKFLRSRALQKALVTTESTENTQAIREN